MAIAVTSLGSVGNTANTGIYGLALSRAPAANTLVLVAVNCSDTVGTVVQPSSVSGAGLVFSILTSGISFDTTLAGNQLHHLSIWGSMGAAPDTSRISASFSNSATGCSMIVMEVSGVSTSGTSGANAVGGSAVTSVSVASTNLAVTGPSATSTANGWLAIGGRGTTGTMSANVNYTSIDSTNYSTPSTFLVSAWTTLSSGNTMEWIGGASGQNAGILIELVADNPAVVGGSTPDTWWMRQLYQGYHG